jgi:hypothetical protein
MNKFHFSIKSFFLLAAIILFVSSCSKDDTVNPDYVGTWSNTTADGGIQIKENMTFTKDGFTYLTQRNDPTINKWVDIIKATATISVTGSTMAITYTGLGISTDYTVPVTMYKTGSSDFQSLMTDNGIPLTFSSKFSVVGNKLTFMTDLNNNGNYTDSGETIVYTKQ